MIDFIRRRGGWPPVVRVAVSVLHSRIAVQIIVTVAIIVAVVIIVAVISIITIIISKTAVRKIPLKLMLFEGKKGKGGGVEKEGRNGKWVEGIICGDGFTLLQNGEITWKKNKQFLFLFLPRRNTYDDDVDRCWD